MIRRGVPSPPPVTGLVLTGGGARAAYQVGVLKGIAEMLPHGSRNPFGVICGTSAGAINATAIATHAPRFRAGVRGLEAVWRSFHADHIYRTEFTHLARNGLRWLAALFFAGLGARRPVSLLDNSPLQGLLQRLVRFERIAEAIAAGDLRALSITASSYATGQSVSFFQGAPELKGWHRARRSGVAARLQLDHLMASSAIPAIFPPVRIGQEYCGDGSVRQLAPMSPALHLGADRVLVIGVGGRIAQPVSAQLGPEATLTPPTLAQIAGHMLDAAFLDTLEGDIERLRRVNRTLELIPDKVRRREEVALRPVDVLSISPSEPLSVLAADHVRELPRSMRFFLRGSGATASTGAVVMSYLLFETGYTRRLINLGHADALRREHEILSFLGHDPVALRGLATRTPEDLW